MSLSVRGKLKCGIALSLGMGFFAASSAAHADTNWTGFYTGVGIGGSQLNTSTNIQELCSFDGYSCDKARNTFNGVAISGYAGWMQPLPMMNMQKFVWGVEGDLNYLGAEGSNSQTYVDSGYDFTVRNRLNFLATLRGKFGVTADNTLIYLTGGLAVGSVENRYSFTLYDTQFSRTQTRIGWVGGVGVEHYLTDNVGIRLEGLYGGLGSSSAKGRSLTSGSSYLYYPADYRVHSTNNFAMVRAGVSIKW